MTNEDLRRDMRCYLVESFIFDESLCPADDSSLLEGGVVDSTGILELILHLEQRYGITVRDEELVPENLDSISAICAFVARKLALPAEGGLLRAVS